LELGTADIEGLFAFCEVLDICRTGCSDMNEVTLPEEVTLHPAALTNCIQPCIGLVQGTPNSGVLGDTDIGALFATRMRHPDG
jgi:hypothetical protein